MTNDSGPNPDGAGQPPRSRAGTIASGWQHELVLTAMAALSAALLMVACGGGDDDGAASATTSTSASRGETTSTTTAPRTPDEAFLAGLEDRDATFDEGGSPEAALEAARQVCDSFDLAVRSQGLSEDLTTTPGAQDLDQTLGDLGSTYWMVAEIEMDQIRTDFGEETGGIVLSLMAEHLCPQHFP